MDLEMICDVLKDARSNINLSQTEVAESVGVTKQTYLKWENGATEPKASQVMKLAQVLKVTEGEICKGMLNKRLPIEKFIIELSKLGADNAIQTLRTWEQVPDHAEYLMSLLKDNTKSEDDIFQIL
ncbi:helix-turn-helix transcriptional regulator [Vibrio sp. F74]|uniref:helix-turn-helix transcriptional regulator n=1 Tax=Vibrio sp. F74 TaxID=700020 RepID=UPI0035F57568